MKKLIKRVIGQNNITFIKQYIKYLRDKVYFLNHQRLEYITLDRTQTTIFSLPHKHVFFGYYDFSQFDNSEKRLLVHTVDKKAHTSKSKAEIGYFNIDNNKYTKITNTSAWSWQQGARLRWNPLDNNQILYNDVSDNEYCTKIWDIENNKCIKTFCAALYDIDPKMKYGLSLNFSRLQRLRPGYGYNVLEDLTEGEQAPKYDGIFYVDLDSNSKKLIISLHMLANMMQDKEANEHYINHISIAPDGKHFIFFHIWTLKDSKAWKTRLYVCEPTGRELKQLECVDRVSHYDWKNNNEIMVTCYDTNKNQYYCVYNIEDGTKTILKDKCLELDGHPSFMKQGKEFISDTYPKEHSLQTLYHYNLSTKVYTPLIRIHSDARYFDEKRCDLHPKVSKSEKYITVDSLFEQGCRKVILFNLEKEII